MIPAQPDSVTDFFLPLTSLYVKVIFTHSLCGTSILTFVKVKTFFLLQVSAEGQDDFCQSQFFYPIRFCGSSTSGMSGS